MMEVCLAAKNALLLVLVATTICGPIFEAQLEARAASVPAEHARQQQPQQPQHQQQQQQQQQHSSRAVRGSKSGAGSMGLGDCELWLVSNSRSDDAGRCFALIESILRSSYNLDMARLLNDADDADNANIISNKAAGQPQWFAWPRRRHQQQYQYQYQHRHQNQNQNQNQNLHQHQHQHQHQTQYQARRDARSPIARPPPFAPDSPMAPGSDSLRSQPNEALSKLMSGLTGVGGGGGGGGAGEEFSMMDGNDRPLWAGSMSDEIQSRWQPMRGKRQSSSDDD